MECAILSSVASPSLQYFNTSSHKRHDFRGESYRTQIVCWIPLQILGETFLIPRKTERHIVKRERKPNKMQQSDVYYQHCLNMFRASLCPSSGEQRPCVTACGMLRWFCWMWLVAVVGRCLVGWEHPTTQRPTTATNHIQQNQRSIPHAVTHGLCSPEDGHNDARNMLRQCW